MEKFLIEWKKYLIEAEGPRKIKFHRSLGQPDILAPEPPDPARAQAAAKFKKTIKSAKPIKKFTSEYLQFFDKLLKVLRAPPVNPAGYRAKGQSAAARGMVGWPGEPLIKMNAGLLAALQALRAKAQRDGNRDSNIYKPCSAYRSLAKEAGLWNSNLTAYTNTTNQVFADLKTMSTDEELKEYCAGGRHLDLASTVDRMNLLYKFCKSLSSAQKASRLNKQKVYHAVTRGFKAYPPGPHTTGRAVDLNLGLKSWKCTKSKFRKEMCDTDAYKWLKQNASMFGLSPFGNACGRRKSGEPWHWEIHPSNAAWALKTFGLEGKRTELQQMAVDTWPIVDKRELNKLLDTAPLDPKKFPEVCAREAAEIAGASSAPAAQRLCKHK